MARRLRWRRPGRGPWLDYAVALAAVALVSALIGVVLGHATIPNISMLYLIAVLATASACGRGPAVLAAVAAFLTFDWFFVAPFHTFTIADPDEWVALLLFLLTAVVTGQLAARERRRAREAETRERHAVLLSDLVRAMSEPDLAAALDAVVERLRRALGATAVALDLDGDRGRPLRARAGDFAEPPAAEPPRRFPVATPERRVGTLTLRWPPARPPGDPAEGRLLETVAAQLGLTVERARLRREATEAESLRRTDELKTALLNAVSHDLRTPLASIMASAGSLVQRDVAWTEGERRDFAAAIEGEARRLDRIVGNLLDLSRIEGGSLRPEQGWYDLGTVVEDALARLRPLTARHHPTVAIAEELPPVLLDPVQIDQVVANLVENAVKYAPPATKIWISVRPGRGEVLVEVADRGPGIPPAVLPRLFTPFDRLDRPGPRPPGLGLGLAVARGLVEAHGGRIRARNRADGGASFVFTLPAAPAPVEPVAPGGRRA
ncbi:MAG TPA: ATP-binding protein [Thermomicrobiales bacterium]|nr:ATP-binding protein [Thermomicrobiales bacterium]